MIHVDRAKYPSPEILTSPTAESTREELRTFFTWHRRTRAQKRFEFQRSIYEHPDVLDMLAKLFHGKCAYCESPIGETAEIEIGHFRPMAGAMDLKGRPDPDHYYWLAYVWENLYPVCPVCNMTKRTYFPVRGKRAARGTMGEELKKERPLLLDPCLDYPELYLDFRKDGMVYPRREIDADQAHLLKQEGIPSSQRILKAEVSIYVYGLNREPLVAARKKAASIKDMRLFRPHPGKLDSFEENIKKILDVTQPYLGMKRQMVEQWFVKTIGARSTPRLVKEYLLKLGPTHDIKFPFEDVSKQVKWEQYVRPIRMAATIKQAAPIKIPTLRTDYIRSIEIRNFKAIKNIRLQFAPEKSERASWKVLLGENGAGKSSVLQAVAMALMGEERLEELKQHVHLDPMGILRHGTKYGWVKISLTDRKTPVIFRMTREGFRYESVAEGVNTFLNAYGTTRLLPLISPQETKAEFREAIIGENLFNPFKPLLDVHTCLYSLKRGREFDRMALTLKDLLHLAGDSRIFKRGRKTWVQVGEDIDPLEELGDGYQSVIVIATDIFKNYPERLYDLQQAVGIVLVDEIGIYLHPRWRMRIVKSLRTAFPRIQFLATTHDPLCLRGLGEKEIAVMERDEETREIMVNDDIPSTAGLRADQLLTSDLFGLHSTVDADVEMDFEEYYKLLAKRELTTSEMEQRDTLKNKLAEYNVKLGATPRDQLLYEAIDDYLAKKRRQCREKSPDEQEAIKQRIVELWREFDDQEI